MTDEAMTALGKIVGLAYLGEKRISVAWDDGAVGDIDFSELIEASPALKPLLAEFPQGVIASDTWSLEWPSGIDFGAKQLRRWATEQSALRQAEAVA